MIISSVIGSRLLDYESRGQEFESLRARHFGIRYRRRKPPIPCPTTCRRVNRGS